MSTPDLSQHQHDEEGGETHDHAPIPPMQNHTLDLRTLTSSEEQILRKVIERDAQEMESLDNRISLIRKDIQDIRVRGALVEGDHQNTMCARCKHKFWLIPLPLTDRGVRCIRCKFRICAKCRFRQINNTWLCILCLRYREEKILSGEWMFNGPIIGLFGSDLMRASLRDKGRVAEDHYTDIPGANGGMQYSQKPAFSKDNDGDSGSRTSVNSTTPSTSGGANAAQSDGLDAVGDTGSMRTGAVSNNDVNVEEDSGVATRVTDGGGTPHYNTDTERPNTLVSGSNNNNFVRSQTETGTAGNDHDQETTKKGKKKMEKGEKAEESKKDTATTSADHEQEPPKKGKKRSEKADKADKTEKAEEPKKGRPKRRSPEANEDSALINSTSGTPLRDNNGDVRASSPGAQRRDSYSKALENQKIRVILPKGNGDDVDGRTDRPHADATHPESTIPMHGGNDDLDESDKESIHSSLSSPSSNRPISKNASTNSSFSSKSSSQSMPTIDNRRARQHSDSSSVQQKSEDEDAYVRGGGNSRYGDRSSMHSGGGGDGLHDYDHTKPGSVGRDSSSERKNSFEEIYDSNVNRLVKMMTAGQVSDSDSSTDARRSSPRLLPRPPDSGKENDGDANGDCNVDELLEKRLSLTEELEESLKYLSLADIKDGGDNNVDVSCGSNNGDNDKRNIDSDNRVPYSHEDRVKIEDNDIAYNEDDQTGYFDNPSANMASESITNQNSECVPQQQGLTISDADIDDVLNHEENVDDVPKDQTGFPEDNANSMTQGKPMQDHDDFESFSLEDQSLMISYLRTPENDVPYEFRSSLSRNDSNASDALSRITEVSEPCGEAESPISGEGSDSDDTLNGGEFDQSFSDDNEVMNSSKSSVINVIEAAKGDSNNIHKLDTSVNERENALSNKDLGYNEADDNVNTMRHDYDNEDEYEPKSEISTTTQDDSGLVDTEPSEASTVGSGDSSSNLPSLNDTLKGDVSFSSSILSEFDLDKDPEDIVKLAMTSTSTPTPDDAGKDTAAAEPTAGSKDVEEAGAGAKSKNGERDPKDSVRDSDSGVNSSQTSRANTPDQRSLSSGGDKGFKLNANTNASPSDNKSPPEFPLAQVPTIAVTEEAREEDDDLDELFSQHRHPYGGSNLSARSSLRVRDNDPDSRESLYSVYSAAGEDHYGDIPVTGEVQFHLEYNYKTGALSIHVKQCKELAPVDTKKNRSDPYVKTYLLPDKTRNGKRKTKIKRHTLNPTYNETLTYTIAKTELESRTLWLSVWNNDRFGRNDFLGEVTIPLDYYEFDKSAPTWYTLQDRGKKDDNEETGKLPSDDSPAMTYKGDLLISLKYVPASMVSGTSTMKKKGSLKRKDKTALKTGLGEIHVLVKEAHNLTAMRSGGGSNPFCKGYLLPDETHHSKQKTPVVKKTTSPNWQHLLVFEGVDETELENHGVELTVWDHETLSSNDFLGGVRLNTGTGYIRGKATDWMDARGEEIEVWQRMTDRHNEWIDIQLPLRASMGKPKK